VSTIKLIPLPPVEAIRYFEQKGRRVSFDYRDFEPEEHSTNFTVAKMMQVDLLQDVQKLVGEALKEGKSMGEFQKELTPKLQEAGWWGRKTMTDPVTGETKEVQLGSARRLSTIYRTNIRRAHAEGQWDRIQESREDFPFLMYDGNNSENPRVQHTAWDGLVLPVNDPFWLDHFPPRDFGCKCRAIQISAEQAESRGLKVSAAPEVKAVPYLNKRTGETKNVPQGVNPAFNFRMGEGRRSMGLALRDRLQTDTPALADAIVQSMVQSQQFVDWLKKPFGVFPIATLPQELADALRAKDRVVMYSSETHLKQQVHHPELPPAGYTDLAELLREAEVILQEDEQNYLFFGKGMRRGRMRRAVVKVTKSREGTLLTSLHYASPAELRRGLKKAIAVIRNRSDELQDE
jgi:SPP1 gp7 family putative phage head morphogenesis protein